MLPLRMPRIKLALARGAALLRGQETENRAHSHLRCLRTALAAAVARRRGCLRRPVLRVPVDLQFHEVAGGPAYLDPSAG